MRSARSASGANSGNSASSSVLDASALLALLYQEPGSDRVADAVDQGAAISAVNLAEVVARLSDSGVQEAIIGSMLAPLEIEVFDFDIPAAYRTGVLRPVTRTAGLSLGDRACLALARHLGVPALTTDGSWAGVEDAVGVTVHVIR